MMQGFFPLASGSKGNCLLVTSSQATLLIDAGISTKRLQHALQKLGKSLEEVEGVIITHEHHDHIASLRTLNEKWKIPVFCNLSTAKGIFRQLDFLPKCKIFSTGEPFSYKDFSIDPFSIAHDTMDPVALKMQVCGYNIGVCTDLGFVSSLVEKKLRDCHILYIEANHDPILVQKSKRPSVYKQRVLGNQGHLSNAACANLLLDIYHNELKTVYLAHLSSECNTAELALKSVENALEEKAQSLSIFIAQQNEPTTPVVFTEMTRPKTIRAI